MRNWVGSERHYAAMGGFVVGGGFSLAADGDWVGLFWVAFGIILLIAQHFTPPHLWKR